MKTTSIILIAGALALVSCKDKPNADAGTDTDAPPASPALRAVLDASIEGEAQDIHLVRKTVKPGDLITVKGWVMGNDEPFVDGRAAFVLGDTKVITACNMRPDDHCARPWDVCCDTPEDIQRGTATIQVVDEDGLVLKEGIEGVGGIKKLSKLLVTGTVAEGSSEDNLVINAMAIDLQ